MGRTKVSIMTSSQSPPPLPPQYPTNESRGTASPFPKEEGSSKLRSSSRASKNACRHNRQKKLRDNPSYEQTRRCSAVALAYWNKNLKPDWCWIHRASKFLLPCEFQAKPKYDHSTAAELFFTELKGNIQKKNAYKVTNVCALGPSDSVSSGLNGCKAWNLRGKEDLPIHHPEGGFNVGYRVHTSDEILVERCWDLAMRRRI